MQVPALARLQMLDGSLMWSQERGRSPRLAVIVASLHITAGVALVELCGAPHNSMNSGICRCRAKKPVCSSGCWFAATHAAA
jgi:hypothetical protein